jgi:hypothetical protein
LKQRKAEREKLSKEDAAVVAEAEASAEQTEANTMAARAEEGCKLPEIEPK